MPTNSFIANVNILADNLENILKANDLFDEDVIPVLREIAELDLMLVVQDLAKGNFEGNKKLDVRLIFNIKGYSDDLTDQELHDLWFNNTVEYSDIEITYRNGSTAIYPLNVGTISTDLVSRIETLLKTNSEFMSTLVGTDFGEVKNDPDSILRFVPINEEISNLKQIRLIVDPNSENKANEKSVVFQWLDTTSSLEVIANNINGITAAMKGVEDLSDIVFNMPQLKELQSQIPMLVDTYTNKIPNGDLTIYNSLKDGTLIKIYGALEDIKNSYNNMLEAQKAATDAYEYMLEAQRATSIEASPTTKGVVYTANTNHITNGTAGHMVDALQLKSELDKKIIPATSNSRGIVLLADSDDVARGVIPGDTEHNNRVITINSMYNIPSSGDGSGTGGADIAYFSEYDIDGNGYVLLPYTMSTVKKDDDEETTRITNMFGKVTAPSAAPVRLRLPSSLIDIQKTTITGTVTTASGKLRVDESNTTKEYVTVGIWNDSTSAWIAGSFYINIIGNVAHGLYPSILVGLTASSSVTGTIVINKV